MAWTAVGALYNATGGGTVTNTTVGNLRVVWTGATVLPVVTGGGVTTWVPVVYGPGTQNGVFQVIAYGLVTATGAQTLAVTHTPFETCSHEFAPASGTPGIDVSGHLSGTSTGTVAGTSLTPTAAADLWAGYMIANSVGTGNTTGVVYATTVGANQIGYHLNAPSGAYAPNFGPSSAWDSVAAMFIASGAVANIAMDMII